MELEGLKNVKVSAHRSQMTFCASCKSCPAIDISTESDTVVVGGEDEGYTEFTKEQFALFVKTVKEPPPVYFFFINLGIIFKFYLQKGHLHFDLTCHHHTH